MVNPSLIKRPEKALMPNENTKTLFRTIYQFQNRSEKENEDEPKIKVSSLISKMAFYYEKIRNTVDYAEERLLRKNAIERIIKRYILIEGAITIKDVTNDQIAKHLLVELIRAGYLPNNQIPESKIGEVALVVQKYIRLKKIASDTIKNKYDLIHKKDEIKERTDIFNWIIGVAASDIEERLSDNPVNKAIVRNMFEALSAKIRLPDGSPYEKDKQIQIYVGIYRDYLKFDQHMLSFILFRYYFSDWKEYRDEDIESIGQNITSFRKAVAYQLGHPLAGQMNKIIGRYTVFYSVLSEVISQNPTVVYNNLKTDPKSFPRDIKAVCGKKYNQASSKLWRAAVRSIIYIFLTKSVFAVLLEVPATMFFGEAINYFYLGVNVIFPPILLFLLVLFTRLPGDDNTARIVKGIEEIAFRENSEMETITLRTPGRRSAGMGVFFGILYAITFFLSFGLIIWGLSRVGFNFVSIIIFIFFLALVSFFGIIIRRGAKELVVVEPKENIVSFVVDFFYIPVITAGKWLSENFSRINVFVFILDFIIEAPFKRFVEIAEEWTRYIRERKDELG